MNFQTFQNNNNNNNNNNNKTVLIKRLQPKSLSAKNTIQTITMSTNIKPK